MFIQFFCFLLCISSIFANAIDVRSLTLEKAEEIALQNNKPLLISTQKQQALHSAYLVSASKLFPTISYSGSFTRTLKPSLVEEVATGTLGFAKDLLIQQFQVDQPILNTNLIFDYRQNNLVQKQAQENTDNTKIDLLCSVRDSYFYLLLQQIAILIQKENVEYLQDALQVEEGRYKLGNATSLEVNQSKVAVANAISEYYDSVKLYKRAKNQLIHVLGIDPALEQELALSDKCFPLFSYQFLQDKFELMKEQYQYDDISFPSFADLQILEEPITQGKHLLLFSQDELEHFIKIAMRLRPDLEMKRLALAISEEEVKRSKSQYLPTVSGFADFTENGGEPRARVFSENSFSWAFGIKFSWDIFDSLARERKISQSIHEKNGSFYTYKYAAQTIETNIRDILYQIEDSIFSYLSASSALLVAEQAMIQAREKLQFGKIPPLDYRDAVNQLAKAKNLQNKSAYLTLANYFLFRKTLGLDGISYETKKFGL